MDSKKKCAPWVPALIRPPDPLAPLQEWQAYRELQKTVDELAGPSSRPSRSNGGQHHAVQFLNKVASPVAMAGMIKSSIHHFDGCGGVGLAGNGGGSGKDGGGAAICGASLARTGIDTVETTFGVVSTISVGCCGGTGGAGCGLSPGAGRVTTGGGDCLAQCNRSLERPGLP